MRRHLLSFCKKHVAVTERMFYNNPIEENDSVKVESCPRLMLGKGLL